DYIFDGGQLLRNTVLVLDAEGRILDLIQGASADESTIETYPGIITPGLINCHCHLELSHLKGAIGKGCGLPAFAEQVMRLRHFDQQEVQEAIARAEAEMWQSGIQAVGDICNTTDTLPQKKASPIRYRNFVECLGFLPKQAVSRFA